jgi:hypothetical protein
MHVHLPKPLHGWRAFVGEVGIIVIGVLIALGAEQLVETAHRRQQAAEADESIRSELGFNLGRLTSRMSIHSCVSRRINEIQELLDGAADEPRIVTPSWIGRPQYWAFASSRWQAESQAGQAALVDPQRLSAYAIMYARMGDLLDEMTAEQADWAKLRTLEHLRRLGPAAAFELNMTLQDARYRDWRLALVTSQLFEMARSLGLHATRNATPASPSVCLAITTSRAEGNRVSVWPFGEP